MVSSALASVHPPWKWTRLARASSASVIVSSVGLTELIEFMHACYRVCMQSQGFRMHSSRWRSCRRWPQRGQGSPFGGGLRVRQWMQGCQAGVYDCANVCTHALTCTRSLTAPHCWQAKSIIGPAADRASP